MVWIGGATMDVIMVELVTFNYVINEHPSDWCEDIFNGGYLYAERIQNTQIQVQARHYYYYYKPKRK